MDMIHIIIIIIHIIIIILIMIIIIKIENMKKIITEKLNMIIIIIMV